MIIDAGVVAVAGIDRDLDDVLVGVGVDTVGDSHPGPVPA